MTQAVELRTDLTNLTDDVLVVVDQAIVAKRSAGRRAGYPQLKHARAEEWAAGEPIDRAALRSHVPHDHDHRRPQLAASDFIRHLGQ